MKTSTSRSYWGKASTNSIDLLGNSCILAIDNIDLTLIKFNTGAWFYQKSTPHCWITPCEQSIYLCFINLSSDNILRLKYQMDKMVLSLPYLFLCLFLTSLFFISVQWLLASFASTSLIVARMKSNLSGCKTILVLLQRPWDHNDSSIYQSVY